MQTFSGALGGIRADAITATDDTDRPYAVGGDTFTDFASAAGRSCDNQMNSCAEMANSGGAGFSVGDCNTQASQCKETIETESTTTAAPATSSVAQTTTSTTPVSVSLVQAKTSSPDSSPPLPPRALAQDGLRPSRSSRSPPTSPALSTASTADGEASSPFVPNLPTPRLPGRAAEFLKTPPSSSGDTEDGQYVTASWGSPYPKSEEANLLRRSPSSEPSEGSTIHRLELDTPFLRPAPSLVIPPNDHQPSSLAAILVNRARRPGPARGLTEDWIRQHTAAGENVEPRHWLSDGTDSEHSSLSGSLSGDEGAWLEERDLKTPRATNPRRSTSSRQSSRQHPRTRSSTETLKQSSVEQLRRSENANMATSVSGLVLPDTASTVSLSTSTPDNRPVTPVGPKGPSNAGMTPKPPVTPTREGVKKEQAPTPRIKKKVPWRGKNIMVLLPRDEGRGQPGKGPIPLRQHEVTNMFREWEELGYDIRGFDLNVPAEYTALPVEHHSRSRDEWPDVEEVVRERTEHKFKVTLPDLDAWRNYMNELTEAKLRALGVSLGGDDPPPPPPSISPNPAGLSRRATITQYPPLPFSPTIPTSSPSSAQGMQQYPFPSQTSAGGINTVASPASFHGHYNQRQSVSIPTNQSPFGFHPPQPQPSPRDMIFQQQGMHRVSPSLSMSPFSPGGFQPPLPHQRHQSLQFPQMPHQQFKHPARASPRLQELRETDEEEEAKSSSKTPEPTPYIRHNASDSLQKEIDEAEYHLEEQFRSQLEHDQDYSPHNEDEKRHAAGQPAPEPTKVFAPQAPRFEGAIDENLVLHHPRPHSRGHSLSQKYFGEEDMRGSSANKAFSKLKPIQDDDKPEEDVETNPSNVGTPVVQNFSHLAHDRTFSTISNPWQNEQPLSRRPSHESKPSFSKLNVAAPEFKFNPTSTFQPGQFNFGSNTFQPAVFQGAGAPNPNASESVHSSNQFSPPAAASSKINVKAPVFSPGSSDFSFSAVGAPTFRPDAPSFTPLQSIAGSVTSPIMSGSESGKMASSIFGNIDLNKPEIVKPVKASKAIPIIRPDSRSSNKEEHPSALTEDEDGRAIDETRVKRLRGVSADDDEHQYAMPSELAQAESKGTEEERPSRESGISSTIVSDSTEARDTTSVSDVSAEHNVDGWAPVELTSEAEVSAINESRELEEDIFKPHHKKSLSATARPFDPSTSFATDDDDKESTPVPSHVDESVKESAMEAEVSSAEQDQVAEEIPQESIEVEPSSATSHAGDHDGGLGGSRLVPSPPPVNGGLAASRFAASPSPKGLAASKYAKSSSPVSEVETVQSPFAPDAQGDFIFPITVEESEQESEDTQETIPVQHRLDGDGREPTFEEIDAVMQHINENDPALGVKKTVELPIWHQPSPTRHLSLADTTDETPKHSLEKFPRGVAPSPSPRHYHLPLGVHPPLHTADLEDPFRDPPHSIQLSRLNTSESQAASDDWERAFSDDEQVKLDSRANFFDGRVNGLVDGVLEARLGPLETSLQGIQRALNMLSERTPPSSHRERRSIDKRTEQIRAAVLDALAVQQRNAQESVSAESVSSILRSMEEMKQHFSESLQAEFRAENLRSVVEEVVGSRLPPPAPQPVVVEGQEELAEKYNDLSARYAELEQRLHFEEAKSSAEFESRRMVEDRAAEFERHLHMAETKIEAEIMNRSAYDQRVLHMEERLKQQEELNEAEVTLRRAAEDRLSEVQRLLRISSEEEIRLRDTVEEKDEKIMILEATHSKNTMRLAMLDVAAENSQKEKGELEDRVRVAEAEARELRQEAKRWRIEAERTLEMSDRQYDDLHNALEDNKQLHKLIDTLGTTLNENERVRDSWRSKFMSLQQDMENAMRHVTEENARRAKREQTMLARQEVLDAKLFAESRTRERLETELERLEAGERQGMKAVNETKRLEVLLAEMRTENHKLQQSAARYQAEFQEARESGAREVQRTRESMQAQIEDANHQVNVVREELEDQISRLRGQLDQVKLDSDTVRSQYDMLMEEAQNNRKGDIKEVVRKHQDEIEDMQARFERQLNNTVEDAQRAETNLLERLSISTSKCEHLQDRVQHLEEKLDIAREAARAAAQAAKASGYTPPPMAAMAPAPISVQSAQRTIAAQAQSQPQLEAVANALQLPEKISPQALRESIMVLQEQLQEREQKIEELEQIADPEAQTKIAKRDDEITWLRELLAVRHSDLQDIITALGRDDYDQDRVRDAAIRLKANLQMEQQERERAASGGSAINLPINIAAHLRDATPRVAQAVGPLAAAWGNWRKGAAANLSNLSSSSSGQSSFLSGLLTPPATAVRQTPPSSQNQGQQPTAFSSTGRRFTAQDLANRPKPPPAAVRMTTTQRQAQKMPVREEGSPAPRQTPPMMRPAAYDDDAMAAEDFDDAGFFIDDE
ncbi:hypothetical protein VMCG_01635 [Cytospora schulzeri]|uniref:Uncharacterized protein n=1 Tax=Cytospora schulzeri TaxID=448051 RepID=A0A423X3N5_9PEZI|nr:hypothetical protein VMCG_01635 [Valsa malicola]